MMQTTATERVTSTARTLALLSLVGVILYVVVDVLLYVLRPELSLLHRAESDYGNGPWAWLMDANFLLRCALSLAAVGALWSVLPARGRNQLALGLLTVWAICSGALAFFSDDEPGAAATPHGKLHLSAAAIAFLCCLIATYLLTGALARLARTTALTAALTAAWGIAAVGFILLIVLGLHPNALGGLYERLFLGGELFWLALAMVWLLRLRAPGLEA